MSLKPVPITLTVHIPEVLEKVVMCLSLAYHRLRYGYGVRLIPVGQGKYALVDADDYERLAKYKWQVYNDGNTYYAFRRTSGRAGQKRQRVLMHREIMDIPEGLVCDHVNRKARDNRKVNLRSATVSQNNCNTRKRGKATSGYRGVTRDARSNRYRARIEFNGRNIHLGTFDDKVDAAKAYDAGAKKYHGEFAVLNFPDRTRYRLWVWICKFFAKIAERTKRSLRTSLQARAKLRVCPKCESSNATSPRAKSSGLLREISPLASLGRNDGMWAALRPFGRNDNAARSFFSTEHRHSICEFFEKIGQNSIKVREMCEKLIEIAQICAIMSIVQMARGP
jgi:hypothetical protein